VAPNPEVPHIEHFLRTGAEIPRGPGRNSLKGRVGPSRRVGRSGTSRPAARPAFEGVSERATQLAATAKECDPNQSQEAGGGLRSQMGG
jgi:hypothetical protein